MDCSPPGSSVHGILQARILEWVAIPFSGGSFQPRDWNHISYICLLHWQAGSLPLAPLGVGAESSRNWKFHYPLFGLWWFSLELSRHLWPVSFSLPACYNEPPWGPKSSGSWLVRRLGPIWFSSIDVVSSGYVILSKVVPCPHPSCFRGASMQAANFAWRKFQREAKLPFLLSFSLLNGELPWGCDFRDTKTPGNPRYLLADLKLSLMNHLFSPWGGERQRQSEICVFSAGWIDRESKNQNETHSLGSASLGTRVGSAFWGEGFFLESSRLWSTWKPSPLVSHLQLQFWPLEGVGPKLQGPGPEARSGILEWSCGRRSRELELCRLPEFTAGETRPREGNSFRVTHA